MNPVIIYKSIGNVLVVVQTPGWKPLPGYSQIIYTINLESGAGKDPSNFLRLTPLARNSLGIHPAKPPLLWQGAPGQGDAITIIHDYDPNHPPDVSQLQIENGPQGAGSETPIGSITLQQA